MPKFKLQEIGDEGLLFLHRMGSDKPARYYRATLDLVSYPGGASFGSEIARIENNGVQTAAGHCSFHQYDPARYVGDALRAALEEYGDAREAATAAKLAKRKAR
jgi:hypothetical protein